MNWRQKTCCGSTPAKGSMVMASVASELGHGHSRAEIGRQGWPHNREAKWRLQASSQVIKTAMSFWMMMLLLLVVVVVWGCLGIGGGFTFKIGVCCDFPVQESRGSASRPPVTFHRRGMFFWHSFFFAFFFGWLLASGFWLLASGSFGFLLVASFWLHFSMEGMYIYIYIFLLFLVFFCFSVWGSFPCYLLHFEATISDLRAIRCILEQISHLHAHLAFGLWPLAFGFWVLALASLGSWLLVFVGFLAWVSLGFWLLAFGRTSVECMCSIVVCI